MCQEKMLTPTAASKQPIIQPITNAVVSTDLPCPGEAARRVAGRQSLAGSCRGGQKGPLSRAGCHSWVRSFRGEGWREVSARPACWLRSAAGIRRRRRSGMVQAGSRGGGGPPRVCARKAAWRLPAAAAAAVAVLGRVSGRSVEGEVDSPCERVGSFLPKFPSTSFSFGSNILPFLLVCPGV